MASHSDMPAVGLDGEFDLETGLLLLFSVFVVGNFCKYRLLRRLVCTAVHGSSVLSPRFWLAHAGILMSGFNAFGLHA